MNCHHPFRAWTIWDSDVGVEFCPQFLDVLTTLAYDAASTLTGDKQANFKLVSSVPFTGCGSGSGARSALIVAAFHVCVREMKWWKMGQIECNFQGEVVQIQHLTNFEANGDKVNYGG